jgi:hypothetical protein
VKDLKLEFFVTRGLVEENPQAFAKDSPRK